VAGRFQNVEAGAAATLGANPYSGKWNHHYFENWTPETAAVHFESELNRLFQAGSGEPRQAERAEAC
jgi:hypothetical protein